MTATPAPSDERDVASAADGVPAPGDCPRCGAPHAPDQAYCLECGRRLTPGAGAGPVRGWRALSLYGSDWAWPVLAALVVAVLVGAAVVAIERTDRQAATETLFATGPQGEEVAATAGVDSGPAETELPAQTLTQPPTTTAPTGTRPAGGRRGSLVQWPAGTNGWSVILRSVPENEGRPAATRQAKAASDAGLSDVGVLDADEYSSLHPGYYVVFAGIFSREEETARAIETARSSGYNDAYAARVAQ